MRLVIRRAVAEDAAVLADLAERIFRDTFGPGNKAEDIEIHVRRSYTPAIQLSELEDPSLIYILAEADGDPAGFAMLGRPRSESCNAFDAPVELFRFYVDKRWHGAGVAAPLMDACETEARALGGRTICLSVWPKNPRAIRFYEKRGFRIVGTQPYILGNDPQTDWVMVRDIAQPAATP